MTFDEYQQAASRTANKTTTDTREKRLTNFALGLAGEAGEVADLIKKHVFHEKSLDTAELRKELGDTLWYLAMVADVAGISLDFIAEQNIEKLRKRYPNGFTSEDSARRVDTH